MSSDAVTAVPPLPPPGEPALFRVRPVVAGLAALGVAVLLVQVWGYGAWLLSAPLEPIRSGVPVPDEISSRVRIAELTSVIGATAWIGFVGFDWWRRRAMTWPLLWTVAWACVFWQEPLVNVRNHTFSFNREFQNLGDWTTHLPFVPDSYSPLPEALVLEGLVFLYLLPLLAIAVAAYARLLRRVLPFASVIPSVVIAYLSVVGFDVAFELQGVHQGLLRYVELGGPAINAGEPGQWPLFEAFAIGAAWAFPGLLTFLLRDHWQVQTKAPIWWTGRRGRSITLLAAIGVTNLVFGLYNTTYIAVMDGTVSEQPDWLAPSAAADDRR